MSFDLESQAVQFFIKLTLVLTAAWLGDGLLSRANPRWQVWLWRVATVGIAVLLLSAALPPLYSIPLLPTREVARPLSNNDVETRLQSQAAETARVRFKETATSDVFSDFRPPNGTPTPDPAFEMVASPSGPAVHIGSTSGPSETNSLIARNWQSIARAVYAIVAVLLLMRLVVAAFLARRERCRTQPAPEWVQEIARRFSGFGQSSIPVRVTHHLESPVLSGLLHATILVPKSMLDSDTAAQDLHGAIAHEAAHAAGKDLLWEVLIAVTLAFVWPHPCVWRMRAAHRAACERVSDRAAADALGDVSLYQRLLARIALRISAPPSPAGLAMARQSDVRKRLAAVVRCPGVPRLGRISVIVAVATTLTTGLFGGGSLVMKPAIAVAAAADNTAGGDAADAPPTKDASPRNEAEPGRSRPAALTFKVIRSDDGKPVADARIGVRLYGRPANLNQDITTDANGEATFQYPDSDQPAYLWAMVHHAGMVPYYVNFGRNLIPMALPTAKIIRMDPGKKVGGIIVDPDGKPVPGAQLSITTPASDTPNEIHYHLYYEKSMDDGTWLLDGAPLNAAGLHLSIEHPRFIRSGLPVQDRLDGRYTVDPGLTLTGRITDADGKPIPAAHITVGRDRWGSVKEPVRVEQDGSYVVHALKEQSTWVTAEAAGYSPQVRAVELDAETPPLNFQLAAGHTTRFRIVNTAGEPAVGAWIVADTWNGFRSLWWRGNTDAEGFVTWNGAPKDAVEFHVGGTDYAFVRDLVVAAQEEPHVVVLSPPLKIEGTVTDTRKQKVPEFRVAIGRKFPGRGEITWLSYQAVAGRNGKFDISYNEKCDEVFLRVEAAGLRPWESGAIPFDDKVHKLFVKLESGDGPAGVIRAPDGRPAVAAKLTLITATQGMQFTGGYRSHGGKETVTSDPDGRFRFLPLEEDSLIAAVHESGYAEVTGEAVAMSHEIRLQPWAKVEVVVRQGNQPLAGARISVDPWLQERRPVELFSYGIEDVTDAAGRVTFDRIVPRDVNVVRTIVQPIGSGFTSYPERSVKVELSPGKTARVEFGGSGSEISGQLSVTGVPPAPHSWTLNEALFLSTIVDPPDSDAKQSFRGLIQKDGSFRLYDIPPGRYELRANLTATPDPSQCGTGARLGAIRHELEVPADGAAVDLGVITGAWDQRLGAGDAAPQFVAAGIGRDAVRLSEFHGKLLLIDFWATWCAPCMADMPRLSKLQQAFADEPRVQILGLSLDNSLPDAEATVARSDWPWINAFAGPGVQATVPRRFDVRAIPEKLLVDVDGKILYRGRDLDSVEKLIRQRLDNWPTRIPPATANASIVPAALDDDFRSGPPVALALAMENIDYRASSSPSLKGPGLMLWSNDGKRIRELDEVGTSRWITGPQRLALDPKRDRIYLCDTHSDRLIALDRLGRSQFATKIPDLHAAAVDEPTGDIWCLATSYLNRGELVVLDPTGREKTRHPLPGFGLAYSPADDVFWIVGKSIARVNRDGRILSSHPLPEEAYTCTDVAVDRRRGGAWVLETVHPDRPHSRQQLWKAKPDGSAAPIQNFLHPVVPRTLACVDGRPWLAVVKNYSAEAKDPDLEWDYEILRFDLQGKSEDPLPVPALDLAVGIPSGSIWVLTREHLLRIDPTGETQLTIPFSAGRQCVQMLAF